MPTQNDTKITLGLDIPKTTSQINSDLKKVQTQLKPLNVKTNIDTSGAKKSGEKAAQDFADAAQKAVDILSKALKQVDGGKLISPFLSELADIGKKMYTTVYEINTAMTDLYNVTDAADTRYDEFLKNAIKSAKELGQSVSGLVKQSTDWAKLGYSLDDSEKLSEVSSVYSNLNKVSNEAAVSDIAAVMKAYDIAVDDAMQIVDKYNQLGNEFSLSAKDLGADFASYASMFASGGTDINKALALLAGTSTVSQSAGDLGSALQIGQMRVQGMKDSLEALGEEADESVSSIGQMQSEILKLTNGKVNILDNGNHLRDYYDILSEVSTVMDTLSSTERSSLIETLFGKDHSKQGNAILQAFQSGEIQKAYEASVNAAGTAMQEQEKWLTSLEAKTMQFGAAFQGLSDTILEDNFLKSLIDSGTDLISILDSVIDTFGAFGTLGLGAGLFAGVQNTSKRRMSVRIS